MKSILQRAVEEHVELLPKLAALEPQMTRLGEALMACWSKRGKALVAGNGAAPATHAPRRRAGRAISEEPQSPRGDGAVRSDGHYLRRQ